MVNEGYSKVSLHSLSQAATWHICLMLLALAVNRTCYVGSVTYAWYCLAMLLTNDVIKRLGDKSYGTRFLALSNLSQSRSVLV